MAVTAASLAHAPSLLAPGSYFGFAAAVGSVMALVIAASLVFAAESLTRFGLFFDSFDTRMS